jgi:hypothetical protein
MAFGLLEAKGKKLGKLRMSYQDLLTAIDLMTKDGSGHFRGHIEDRLIQKAESLLGLKFPPTYRRFVQEFGCGDILGLEIYGIIHENFERSGIPDAIWLTLEERKAGFPTEMVIVGFDGTGGYYALDSRIVDRFGEYPVVLYGVVGDSEVVATDFGAFLVSQINALMM